MNFDQAQALTVPLTAAEQVQVERAAAVAGKSVEDFLRDVVLAAAYDPLLAALDQAADTMAAGLRSGRVRHDFAA
ncbi:hypothetical protein ACFCWY_08785 [Streptomyces sp. NPDC056362]|uniref:hypothetical protein n=1 Tax=unclassified Streptomyces TaxID=2593676 RepID=UPI0035DEEC50